MNIISIISDRLPGDFILGRLKGYIHKNIDNISIIDFALGIPSFNIQSAGFLVKNGYKNFPDNTIHIIGVDSEKNINQSHLAVKSQGQYFLCADNGIISLILEEGKIDKIIEFPQTDKETYNPSLFMLADIAFKIILNNKFIEEGENFIEYKKKILFNPTIGENFINGSIIYVDSYKNAVTNIDKEIFENIRKNKKFLLYIGSKKNVINKISNKYSSVEQGEIVAIFNSNGLLEIAMNKGKLMTLFNFSTSTSIRIDFYD